MNRLFLNGPSTHPLQHSRVPRGIQLGKRDKETCLGRDWDSGAPNSQPSPAHFSTFGWVAGGKPVGLQAFGRQTQGSGSGKAPGVWGRGGCPSATTCKEKKPGARGCEQEARSSAGAPGCSAARPSAGGALARAKPGSPASHSLETPAPAPQRWLHGSSGSNYIVRLSIKRTSFEHAVSHNIKITLNVSIADD